MNLSSFTVKASEIVQQAQQIAFNHSNSNIETEHFLKALLDQKDSPVEYLLKKTISKKIFTLFTSLTITPPTPPFVFLINFGYIYT